MNLWLGRVRRALRLRWQQLTRGWDDSDTWSLDHALAKLFLPRLRRFRELRNGHPAGMTEAEWDAILGKMEAAFTIIASEDYWLASDEQEKVIEEGLDLFREYYQGLWW